MGKFCKYAQNHILRILRVKIVIIQAKIHFIILKLASIGLAVGITNEYLVLKGINLVLQQSVVIRTNNRSNHCNVLKTNPKDLILSLQIQWNDKRPLGQRL